MKVKRLELAILIEAISFDLGEIQEQTRKILTSDEILDNKLKALLPITSSLCHIDDQISQVVSELQRLQEKLTNPDDYLQGGITYKRITSKQKTD